MAEDPQLLANRLVGQTYYPHSELSDWLPSLLKETMAATDSVHGEIRLKSQACVPVSHENEILLIDKNGPRAIAGEIIEDRCTVCAPFNAGKPANAVILNDSASEMHCASIKLLPGSNIVAPISYQGALIGLMTLGSQKAYRADQAELCRLIAASIACHFKRYEVCKLITANLGKDCLFVGTSKELTRIDEFIEKASRVNFPVLISGEFGTGKKRIAYALHYAGPRRCGPFVEIICSTLDKLTSKAQLRDRFAQVDNGTIFFNGLDELKVDLQYQLVEFLESGFVQWARKKNDKEFANARMVASVSKPLDELVREGSLCRSLTWQFDFLEIPIAPLRDRKEDIKSLFHYFVEKYAIGSVPKPSDEVLKICEAYDWPGNNREMERIVARLLAFSEEDTITIDDLILHAPNLVQSVRRLQEAVPLPDLTAAAGDAEPIRSGLTLLARSLITEEFTGTEAFHPAMRKALIYLARNFAENISIGQLATRACVSSSHLSYLFQKTLGANFKSVLALVRIEKSKELLLQNPYESITNVSCEVGFGELRHFERTFKHLVGCTPREYRRDVGLEQQSPIPPRSLIASHGSR